VGVNRFAGGPEKPIPTLTIHAEIERSQVGEAGGIAKTSGFAKDESIASGIERRAASTENLMPAILNAVEAYATVGEISDAMRRVFGEFQEFAVFLGTQIKAALI